MADLKIGTTIGGSAIWTKGSLPLVPSSNTLTYNGYKLYSEYDKPTPAELGVYAKSETYSKTEVNELGKIRVLDIRDTNKTPSEYPDKILSTFFNSSSVSGALPLTATWYSGFTVKGWTDGYVSWQIASMSNTGASDNKLWFRASQSDTTWGTWGRIYTEFDKPTASDVRALPVSGQALNDTALGVRRLNKTIAFEVGQDSVPYISVDLAYRALSFNSSDRAAGFIGEVYANSNKRVFHEGYIPSPEQVKIGRYWGQSDYANGTLIATSIDATVADGDSFTVDIIAKAYTESKDGTPLHIVAEGYLYQNKFINTTGFVVGAPFSGTITFLKMSDGKLGIWFPRQKYWNNYGVIVTATRVPGWKANLVTGISDTTKPSSDRSIDVLLHKVYGSYTAGPEFKGTIVSDSAFAVRRNDTTPGKRWMQLEIHPDGNMDLATSDGTNWYYPLGFSVDNHTRLNGSLILNPSGGSGSTISMRNWGNTSGRWTVQEVGDVHGWWWYCQRATNSVGGAINFAVNGSLSASGSFTATESINTNSRAFRTVGNKFGTFWHNDGGDTLYLMFTNPNDQYGSWSNFRPVYFNMTSGHATFGHGVSSSLGFHLPTNVSITFNAGGHWSGGIGWGLQEESSSGDMILHKYSSGAWQAAPFRFQNDHQFVCAGNGNFNDVYIRSDKRLKSNIELTTNHLEKILKLKPVAYDKKATLDAETTERELGLIAQDVEKIIPLAVGTGSDEHKIKALKPYALIATLIGAVQEQQKQIDELKAMLNK